MSLLLVGNASMHACKAQKLNILFIFANNCGWGDLPCN